MRQRNEYEPGSAGAARPARGLLARCARLLVPVAGLVLVGALAAHAVGRITAALHVGPAPGSVLAAAVPAAPIAAHKVLTDDWSEMIRSERFWRTPRPSAAPADSSRRASPSRTPPPSWLGVPGAPRWDLETGQRRLSQPPPDQKGRGQPKGEQGGGHSGGYRTVCVRACDGFFFPISFNTSADNFARDAAQCQRSCAGGRLYVHRSPGEDADDMVDYQTRQPYSRLRNANLFRTVYDEGCKCKPHAWEQEAQDRHRIYALEAQRRKGNRAVTAELEQLKSKMLLAGKGVRKGAARPAASASTGGGTGEPRGPGASEPEGARSEAPAAAGNAGVVASAGTGPGAGATPGDVAAAAPSVAADLAGMPPPMVAAPAPAPQAARRKPRQAASAPQRPNAMRLGAGTGKQRTAERPAPAPRAGSSDWVVRAFSGR